jgi:hypothetical protein
MLEVGTSRQCLEHRIEGNVLLRLLKRTYVNPTEILQGRVLSKSIG